MEQLIYGLKTQLSFKRDEELIKWFEKEYSFLKDNKTIEVLFENTDFGVGD